MSSSTESKIYFFFETPVTLRKRGALKAMILSIFKKENRQLESLNYIFCTDKRLLAINQEYLAHDDYTDIITFELSPRNAPVTGEIYISIDRVKENARLHNATLSQELHRVMFHGALHLCGYGDKSQKDKKTMRDMEDLYLKIYK